MKKVFLSHPTAEEARAAAEALSALSGVLAVDVQGTKTVAHCGDELEESTLVHEAAKSGLRASVLRDAPESYSSFRKQPQS